MTAFCGKLEHNFNKVVTEPRHSLPKHTHFKSRNELCELAKRRTIIT